MPSNERSELENGPTGLFWLWNSPFPDVIGQHVVLVFTKNDGHGFIQAQMQHCGSLLVQIPVFCCSGRCYQAQEPDDNHHHRQEACAPDNGLPHLPLSRRGDCVAKLLVLRLLLDHFISSKTFPTGSEPIAPRWVRLRS